GWAVKERRFGRFSRTLPLPNGIKPESIKAKLDNGVLTVNFPQVARSNEKETKKINIA
ncbi:hypothetical protein M422DRAFT_262283, partial [Sphaerobolus stellatus SS14]